MAMYESFARVYDRFMDNVPYDEWAARLREIFQMHGIDSGLVLDLGCGTGQMTRRFRDFGYDMIGVDGSEDMLEIALEKEQTTEKSAEEQMTEAGELPGESGKSYQILYLLQDMREFELYGTVRGIYSCCDCMNYLYTEEDLLTVFRLAENYLDPGGIFVFDMNTASYYEKELGQNTYADVRDECSVIWENDYDPETMENEYDLTIFVRTPQGLYERTKETHYEKAYPFDTVKSLAERAGLILDAAFDGYCTGKLRKDSSRMLLVFRKSSEIPLIQ